MPLKALKINDRLHKRKIRINDPMAEKLFYKALDVFKKRWPAAEPIIMTDAFWAFCYARAVIKGRWLEAEPSIKKGGEYLRYMRHFGLPPRQ